MFREAKAGHDGDPVAAWAEITGNPALARRYKAARGTGGFVRASWDEAVELAAATAGVNAASPAPWGRPRAGSRQLRFSGG
jgi:nitrate reductase alpha subunit